MKLKTTKTKMILNLLPSWACKFGAMALAYFAPIAAVVHVMLIFLAVDLISGVFAAWKAREKIESKKLQKTVYKLIWYTVAVMMAWMMEKTFNLGWTNLANITGGFICFIELKSIFENIAKITDEPIFKSIIRIFKRKLNDKVDDIGHLTKDKEDASV